MPTPLTPHNHSKSDFDKETCKIPEHCTDKQCSKIIEYYRPIIRMEIQPPILVTSSNRSSHLPKKNKISWL